MTEFNFKVGDVVYRPGWANSDEHTLITMIGEDKFYGIPFANGQEKPEKDYDKGSRPELANRKGCKGNGGDWTRFPNVPRHSQRTLDRYGYSGVQSAGFNFKPGDLIRRVGWGSHHGSVEVLAVGEDNFIGRRNGNDDVWAKKADSTYGDWQLAAAIPTATTWKLKVGDIIKRRSWGNNTKVRITSVGSGKFLAREVNQDGADGAEYCYDIAAAPRDEWVKVVVFPEKWWTIYPGGNSYPYPSESRARNAASSSCIGILHLRVDGTTEMLEVGR